MKLGCLRWGDERIMNLDSSHAVKAMRGRNSGRRMGGMQEA